MPLHKATKEEYYYDVAICGGGLAGLTLARQVKRACPEYSVAIIDRMSRPLPELGFKVGESVTEAGAYYLANVLDLTVYFEEKHLNKLGFRFFFGDPTGRFEDRPEFGLSRFPVIRSYNIDRGLLENDLRQFNAEDGIAMIEGYVVKDIMLANGDGKHTITLRPANSKEARHAKEARRANGASRHGNGNRHLDTVRSRWVIDAMGRRRYLQKKLNLARPQPKRCSASWFRFAGRIDISELVPKSNVEWHQRVPNNVRYYSTNHLMGTGYWVWLIPLPTGSTSIGIVAANDIHPESDYNTYAKSLKWLQKHEPQLLSLLEGGEPIDFRFMKHYTYSSRQLFSKQRWSCIGDAGFFSDPLYAAAMDFIALSNSITTQMIKQELRGELTPEAVQKYNQTIIALNDAITQNIQLGYPLFNNPAVMAAKVLWDTAAGWSLLAPQIYNTIFKDDEINAKVRKVKSGYFFLTQRIQQLFVDWTEKSSGRCTFDFIDFLAVPLLLELRKRNLAPGKSAEELIDDHVRNMEQIEELAMALFLVAVEDVLSEPGFTD